MRALPSSLLHAGFKNLACLHKNLSFPFIFLRAFLGIDSKHKLLPRRQPSNRGIEQNHIFDKMILKTNIQF